LLKKKKIEEIKKPIEEGEVKEEKEKKEVKEEEEKKKMIKIIIKLYEKFFIFNFK
jgi:hypothetical protein